jgi:hypothetical protein
MKRPIALATVFLLLVPSCGRKCDLEEEVKRRSASGAIDCGHVELGADRSAVDACVVDAFRGMKAFYARYEARGTDSHVVHGVLGSVTGLVTLLVYDGDPGGGGGDGRPVITANTCEESRLIADLSGRPEATPPFECGSVKDLGRICE